MNLVIGDLGDLGDVVVGDGVGDGVGVDVMSAEKHAKIGLF